MTTNPAPKQVTIAAAAVMLAYSQKTVRRLIAAGVLPSTGSGRLRRIPVAAIDALMERLAQGESVWAHATGTTNQAGASVRSMGRAASQDKDGQWWYAPPTVDGKRSSPIRCASESAAKAKQREWLKARDHGVNPNDGRQSLQDFLTFWYNEATVPNVKPKTAHFYRQMIELYILPELGTIRLDKLQPEHVVRLLNNLRDDLSPRTIRHIYSVLRQALDRAVKWRKLLYNPAAMVDPPKVIREEQTPLTPAQSGALLTIVAGHRLSALYHVALTLGLRKGELLGLRWADLNWDAATLKITQQVQSIGGTTRFETPKSATSVRTLPLTAEMIARLRTH